MPGSVDTTPPGSEDITLHGSEGSTPPEPETSPSRESESVLTLDIGYYISGDSQSNTEISRVLKNLSNSEKVALLYDHIPPPTVLPSRYSHGCNRKFNVSWLEKYQWLRYSQKLDAVFCGPCSLFLEDRHNKGHLVNRPFSHWVKISNALKSHSQLSYHRSCAQLAEITKSTIENPASRIDVMSSTALQLRIQNNQHIIQQIVRAIIFLAKQGLPLRGDKEDIMSNKNPGNFLALLKSYSETDEKLHRHLHSPRARNATYLSPRSQNELISVIGYDMIQADIVHMIKKARFFSVLADEVTSHNEEHLPLCLRFVDENCDIQEVFVAFIKLQRVRSVDIVEAIIATIEELGMCMSDIRGQGYDGAANMAGAKSGVQKRIRDIQPKAVYTHCAGHSLNLAVVSSCSLPVIRNCIDKIKSFTIWVTYSPKREELLKKVYHMGDASLTSHNPLLNVCITRWVENIDGWERFCLCHPFLLEMCEVIVYGTNNPELDMYNNGWSADDKKNALAHIKVLESFEFVFTLTALQRSLMYLKEATVFLQGQKQDLVSGLNKIAECCSQLQALRKDVDIFSHRIYEHSCRIAEKSGISITMPRITLQQRQRCNPPSTSIEEYMKTTVVIPFLDHLISNLSDRFDSHTKTAASLQGLFPRNISNTSSAQDIKEAVAFYADDLPNAGIIDEEFHLWKSMWLSVPINERPETLSNSMKCISQRSLPNIFTLLKIFATIPLSSCSCERSASTLRRLNSYMRCTQTKERLTALALIHTYYETDIDVKSVCKRFMEKHSRRLECVNMLFED